MGRTLTQSQSNKYNQLPDPYTNEGLNRIFQQHRADRLIPRKYRTVDQWYQALTNTIPIIRQSFVAKGAKVPSLRILTGMAADRLVQISELGRRTSSTELNKAGLKVGEIADQVARSVGYFGIPMKTNSKGVVVGFDNRHYRDSIPKSVLTYLKKLSDVGAIMPNAAAIYAQEVEKHWSDLQRELRGKGMDRGHTNSGKYGGPRGPRAVFAELSKDNRSHGEIARMMRHQAQALGIPWTWMEDAIEFVLQQDNLGVNNFKLTPEMVNQVDSIKGPGLDANQVLAVQNQKQLDEAGVAYMKKANEGKPFYGNGAKPPSKPQEIMSIVSDNSAIKFLTKSRMFVPAVAGVGALLSANDALAREEAYKKDPSFINGVQRNISKVEVAADVAGVVPGPHSAVVEPVGFGAGATNTIIDALRSDLIKKMKMVRGALHFRV